MFPVWFRKKNGGTTITNPSSVLFSYCYNFPHYSNNYKVTLDHITALNSDNANSISCSYPTNNKPVKTPEEYTKFYTYFVCALSSTDDTPTRSITKYIKYPF